MRALPFSVNTEQKCRYAGTSNALLLSLLSALLQASLSRRRLFPAPSACRNRQHRTRRTGRQESSTMPVTGSLLRAIENIMLASVAAPVFGKFGFAEIPTTASTVAAVSAALNKVQSF